MLLCQQREIKITVILYPFSHINSYIVIMKVWCSKHLVYKYMCILQDTCMLFICVLSRYAMFVRKQLKTQIKSRKRLSIVVEFEAFFACMLFCTLSKPACVFQNKRYLVKVRAIEQYMAAKHSKKCQSCNSCYSQVSVSLQYTTVCSTLVCVRQYQVIFT